MVVDEFDMRLTALRDRDAYRTFVQLADDRSALEAFAPKDG